jgi:CBS domain-containing protein
MICPSCGHSNLPGADECVKCQFALASVDMPTPGDKVEGSLMTDTVAVLKPRQSVTVSETAPLGTAVGVMLATKVGAVLVTGPDDSLVGILTERDFLTKVVGQSGYEGLPVRQFMTPNPETVVLSDPLAFALRKMDVGGYRHLPVVENGKPIGVVSVRDVIRHITRLCKET